MGAAKKKRNAQLSIEFLLVMAGFVMALVVFTPVAIRASKSALYVVEGEKAKAFLSEFRNSALQALFLSDGTVKEISVNARADWQFTVGSGKASVTVKSESLGREKTYTVSVPGELPDFSVAFKGKKTVRMEKSNSLISLGLVDVD